MHTVVIRDRAARAARIIVGSLAAGTVVAATAVALGGLAFKRQVSTEVAALFAKSAGVRPSILTEGDVARLPEPVQRWLWYSQVIGKERPVTVRLKQEGLFSRDGKAWMPFNAQQYYTTDPPGFIWSASMEMAPGLRLTGRDRYFQGHGNMTFRLLSLIPVVNARGPELDQGTLLRYLNETMWFPAVAAGPYISWEEIDRHAAMATMSYGDVSASAMFYFGDNGDLINMEAQRYRAVEGGYSLDRWATPISVCREFNGVRIPTEGVAVWKLREGDLPYIKLRITELEYNRAELF